ncbi:uncharacterized protein MELLADRAFT_115456 [Melampsora larici-populina 98AG31]|uniref:Uncharacterized protein n=1 Tax=Melampsora larici-populina (strain 98AG31 / pathotype 3-4-7) TaxID=747676 RepID=F4RAQ8_MELLP|nr:uncharacterized protein MELLADRAFT_115456 [Melampsora larici-populina 98AG31]EGG10740.1 hypothetical protein MELLADRAFT_115456 [Melampsora larici-populina 98AG31]
MTSSSTHSAQDYIHQLSIQISSHQDSLAAINSIKPSSGTSTSFTSWSNLSTAFGLLNQSSTSTPTTLNLDPHHLYYLLLKFEEIGIQIGSLDIQNPHQIKTYDPTQWMIGFNSIERIHKIDKSDTISLFSNLSNLSIGSTWWSGTTSAIKSISNLSIQQDGHRTRTIEEEVKYLYSSFTKLPSLKLTPTSVPTITSSNPKAGPKPMQLLEGFTDLPNQNLVPLICFKSLWTLSIHDLDPRLFIGWNQLSQSLRSLEIRRSGLEDIERLLIDSVMFDVEREVKLESNQQDLADEQNSLDLKNEPTVESDEERRAKETEETDLTNSSTEETNLTNPPSSSQDPSNPQTPPPSFPPLAWRFLHHLCLADNALTFIPSNPLAALVSLVSLDLSSNLLIVVPNGLSSLIRLKSLSLADNMIDSVLGIYQNLGNVTTINLSKNRLTSLCGLERLYSLERLDIRSNKIQDISELSRLATLPSLTNLWTSSNPFTNQREDWRPIIFNYFIEENRDIDLSSSTSLNLTLDNLPPTYQEKKLLKRSIGRTLTPDPITSTTPSPKPIVLRSPGSSTVGTIRRSKVKPTSDGNGIPSSSEDNNSSLPFSKKSTKVMVIKKDKTRKRTPRIIELDHVSEFPKKPISQIIEPNHHPIPSSSNLPSSSHQRIGNLSLDGRIGSGLGSTSGSNHDEDHPVSFRKKIETLRDEVGDGWLKVLGESEFGQTQTQTQEPIQSKSKRIGNGNGHD